MRVPRRRALLGAVPLGLLAASFFSLRVLSPQAQEHQGAAPSDSSGHGAYRTPEGWKFTLPKGDPIKGRDLFTKFECYSCHEVKGQKFPALAGNANVGPELSQMGPLHDGEYFAEAIINPGATIEADKGYAAPDGSSKMPSFNDSLTVQEMIDLVTFLKGLQPGAARPSADPYRSSGAGDHPGH